MIDGRAALVARFNRIEEEFPVSGSVLEGAHIWPVVRVVGGGHHVQVREDFAHRAPPPRGSLARLRSLVRGTFARMPAASPGGGELMFLSEPGGRVDQGGHLVDRFAHPLMQAAAELGHATMLVVQGGTQGVPVAAVPRSRVLDVAHPQYASNVRHWRRPMTVPGSIPGLPSLLDALESHGLEVPEKPLTAWLHAFRAHLAFHRGLLARTRPAHVFLWCWYGLGNMAMAHACRELGIPCTDLQHGVQGPAHLAYGRWAAVPAGGWSTMPHRFWCWDAASVAHIASWAPAGVHVPYLGGSPWLERHAPTPTGPGRSQLRVLFTMQPMERPVPEGLAAVMRRLGDRFHWTFRTHPLGSHDLAGLPGMDGVGHLYTMEDGRAMPLGRSLARADIHLTLYSSVVLEAVMAGVPSIALHPHAGDLFPEHVRSGRLRVVDVGGLAEALTTARATDGPRMQAAPLKERLARFLNDPPGDLPGAG